MHRTTPTNDPTALISAIPFFNHLSAEQLAWLQERSTLLDLPAGTTIATGGDDGAPIFMLAAGEWTLERQLYGADRPLVFTSRHVGTWHGGDALIDAIAPGHFTTLQPSQILKIPMPVLIEMIRQGFPGVVNHLLAGIGEGAQLLRATLPPAAAH